MTRKPATLDLLTVAQAAQLLGVDHSTVCRWITDGRLQAIRPGARAYLIHRSAVESFTRPVAGRPPSAHE